MLGKTNRLIWTTGLAMLSVMLCGCPAKKIFRGGGGGNSGGPEAREGTLLVVGRVTVELADGTVAREGISQEIIHITDEGEESFRAITDADGVFALPNMPADGWYAFGDTESSGADGGSWRITGGSTPSMRYDASAMQWRGEIVECEESLDGVIPLGDLSMRVLPGEEGVETDLVMPVCTKSGTRIVAGGPPNTDRLAFLFDWVLQHHPDSPWAKEMAYGRE